MRAVKAKALRREAKEILEGGNFSDVTYIDVPGYKTVMTVKGPMIIEVFNRRLGDSVRKVYKMLKKMEG